MIDRIKSVEDEIREREESRLLRDDERARFFGLPEGCRMREGVKIYSKSNFKCGNYCWFGEDCKLDASGGLEIGDHTTIGLSVFVWSHSSAMANLMMDNRIGNQYIVRKKTKIGSGVFIGGHAVIYSGVIIGDKCIILPMSVVTKDIPSYSIVGGSPAKVIKTISEDWIKEQVSG